MSDYAIRVEGLSKQYIIDHENSGRSTFRDMLAAGAKSLTRRFWENRQPTRYREEFWALKDVSFEIKQGERVGIIGRNGAGKSTLLKILSRITEPSSGRISINGRVASLLEVGTGFHAELTGRENIYLNGAVLGMSREEIRRKFDEIVAFSEVEKFLDTPVKRYSSGMYVRLAFAVAAHLEPEVLIVDEVLAVGDSQFQKKCLGKMEDISQGGRTILFVSHNMGVVTSLCTKAILLHNGQVKLAGNVEKICSEYLTSSAENTGFIKLTNQNKNTPFFFRGVRLMDIHGQITSKMDVRDPIRILIDYSAYDAFRELELSLRVSNQYGSPVFTSLRSHGLPLGVNSGEYTCEVEIPKLFLSPGRYGISVAAFTQNQLIDHQQEILSLEVEETGSNMAIYSGHSYGSVLVNMPWKEKLS